MKRKLNVAISVVLCAVLAITVYLSGCGTNNKPTLYILNFGDYINPDIVSSFERDYNCIVKQDLFEANEEVQPILERPDNSGYDLVCLSEYMIERLKKKDIFEELTKTHIQNYKNIDTSILDVLEIIDSGNKIAVPYFKGDIGICYNKNMLEEKHLPIPKEWSDLWNPVYKNELIMSSSLRDLFSAGAYKNGFSSNTENEEEIKKVFDDFIIQKPLVQGYFSDQIKDKLLSGNASIGLMLSGDMQYIYDNGGEEFYYLIPTGPKNVFIDAWCMLKSAKNKPLAYKFLDYLLIEDSIKSNCEYVGYESVYNTIEDEEYLDMKSQNKYIDNSTSIELERDLSPEATNIYAQEFLRLKSHG